MCYMRGVSGDEIFFFWTKNKKHIRRQEELGVVAAAIGAATSHDCMYN